MGYRTNAYVNIELDPAIRTSYGIETERLLLDSLRDWMGEYEWKWVALPDDPNAPISVQWNIDYWDDDEATQLDLFAPFTRSGHIELDGEDYGDTSRIVFENGQWDEQSPTYVEDKPTHEITLVQDHQVYDGQTMRLDELEDWIAARRREGRTDIVIEVYADEPEPVPGEVAA